MCLIIHREVGPSGRGSNVPNEVINYNRDLNPDGFGISWRESDGDLRTAKFGPKDFHDFRDLLKNIDRDTGIEYVAHFRRATHGPACERLSHPFTYDNSKDGEVHVFHNGVISIDADPSESDTSVFVNRILQSLKPRWWSNEALRYLVEEAIGYSRILIMTAQETVRINPTLWSLHGGIYYSTDPFPSKPKVITSHTMSTHASGGGWRKTPYSGNVPVVVSGKGNEPSVVKTGETITVDASAKGASGFYTPTDNDTFDADEPWVQDGHTISALGIGKKDTYGDIYGTAVCEVCHTIGDYCQISGKVYVDVNHFFDGDEEDDKEEEALLQQRLRALS